jgi:hypothetical protein
MLNVNSVNPDPQLATALAIYFAKLTLPVWQQRYSGDSRPEKAIAKAEKVLFSSYAYDDFNAFSYSADAHDAASAAYAADAAASAASAAYASAAYAAAYADAADAASAAYAAAASAAYAAAYAAYAAAAYAASDAADAASCAANSANAALAASAAAYAARSLGRKESFFTSWHLSKLLPVILWHKLSSKRSFGEPEKIFELLPESCKEDFLFNFDTLR